MSLCGGYQRRFEGKKFPRSTCQRASLYQKRLARDISGPALHRYQDVLAGIFLEPNRSPFVSRCDTSRIPSMPVSRVLVVQNSSSCCWRPFVGVLRKARRQLSRCRFISSAVLHLISFVTWIRMTKASVTY